MIVEVRDQEWVNLDRALSFELTQYTSKRGNLRVTVVGGGDVFYEMEEKYLKRAIKQMELLTKRYWVYEGNPIIPLDIEKIKNPISL